MDSKFEWDKQKAAANIKKHGVTFDEAVTVFDDPLAGVFNDAEHSFDERREIIIGESIFRELLIVSFTERGEGVIRIISARSATKPERHEYEENQPF